MNFIDLVSFFRKNNSLEDFCQKNNLDNDSEVIEIYMQKPFGVNNELSFFEIEKTDGRIAYLSNGIMYYELLDMYHFREYVLAFPKKLTDEQIAIRLLDYANNDA